MRAGPALPSIAASSTGKGSPAQRAGARATAGEPSLRVTRGGRTSVLVPGKGTHLVGGGAECDLVVVGLKAEPAFRLELWGDGSQAGAVVEALGTGIKVGTRDLRQGERAILANGAVIHIADVQCVIEGLPQNSTFVARSSRRRIAAVGLLAIAALLLVASLSFEGAPAPSEWPSRRASAEPRPTAASIAAELSEATRLAGLNLLAEVTPDGTKILVGENASPLDLASQRRLASILSSIGGRSPVPLVDRTRLASGLEGFVAAAGYSPVKFIVGRDGRRYREGDAISGEWRIEEIRPGQIVVAHGGERDTVDFEQPEPRLKLNLAKVDSPETGQ
ncbi:hypothetical protein [Ensifer sp. LCM 4579]|uniref:hypothetical protein n=1 Tax=Ensifer sp. LCM 4579 TaxID=1848292 RepID=UPI0008DA55FE|nr:hypothetical protein [Ensifer sp. LCM 4579]OHV80114.1 hypothetical protein LCM4579_23330 [Ensifer sp. LCM 4579]